jgi:beta-barrel assembly-enhancing protease
MSNKILIILSVIMLLTIWWVKKNDDNNTALNSNKEKIIADTHIEKAQEIAIENTNNEVSKKQEVAEKQDKPSKWKQKNKTIDYNLSCVRQDGLGALIGIATDIEDVFLTSAPIAIDKKQEQEIGKEFKANMHKEHTIIESGKTYERLKKILNNLIQHFDHPPKFNYQLWIFESEEINAFTAGGQIFVSIGIIQFAKNDDELAGILAHEIYHNELGHINKNLKKQQISKDILGDELGTLSFLAGSIFTMSFNQENEVYCDLYGLDLAVKAGYDGCQIPLFWQRMKNQKSENEDFTKIFNTHPFSKDRITCLHQHIQNNYEHRCK